MVGTEDALRDILGEVIDEDSDSDTAAGLVDKIIAESDLHLDDENKTEVKVSCARFFTRIPNIFFVGRPQYILSNSLDPCD